MLKSAYWSTGLKLAIAIVCVAVLSLFGCLYCVYVKIKRRESNVPLRPFRATEDTRTEYIPTENTPTEGSPTEDSPTQIIIGFNHQLELPISRLPSYDDVEKDFLPSYDEIDRLPPVYTVQ